MVNNKIYWDGFKKKQDDIGIKVEILPNDEASKTFAREYYLEYRRAAEYKREGILFWDKFSLLRCVVDIEKDGKPVSIILPNCVERMGREFIKGRCLNLSDVVNKEDDFGGDFLALCIGDSDNSTAILRYYQIGMLEGQEEIQKYLFRKGKLINTFAYRGGVSGTLVYDAFRCLWPNTKLVEWEDGRGNIERIKSRFQIGLNSLPSDTKKYFESILAQG